MVTWALVRGYRALDVTAMCLCVCVSLCVRVCACVSLCVCTCECESLSVCVCFCFCCVCTLMNAQIPVSLGLCPVHMSKSVCRCVFVCVRVCMYVHFTLLYACGLVQVCTTRFDLALSPMNSYGTGLHVILLVWMNWVTVSTWTG